MHANRAAKFFIRRGALARIGEFVPSDETVECIAAGTYFSWGNRSVTVVLTNRRLLLMMGGRRLAEVRDYSSESISSVKSTWVDFGDQCLTVVANGKRLPTRGMNADDADEMAHWIRVGSSGRRSEPARPPRRDDLGKIKRWRVAEE
jgi:hypothetical protein